MLLAYLADDEEPRFVVCSRRDLNEHLVEPKKLRLDKVYAVFFPVCQTLLLIELILCAGRSEEKVRLLRLDQGNIRADWRHGT